MKSTRLPGKVLADFGGEPMLAYLLRRLQRADLHVVVATSTLPDDDPVVDVAGAAGVATVRGSERDVLDRYRLAAQDTDADHVVRITADCPLTDPAIVDAAVALHLETRSDYTSNSLIRTYPDGLDVEVISAAALHAAAAEAVDPVEREHVMPFVYRRPERFRLAALRGPALLGAERWTVDRDDDLRRLQTAVLAMGDPLAPWQDFLRVLPPAASSGRRLRPTGPRDLAAVGEWLAPILDDPADRTWVVDDDGDITGWIRIPVQGAVGTMSWSIDGAHVGWLLDTLDVALQADGQIVHLRVDATMATDDFACRGFERHGDWLVRDLETPVQAAGPPAP